MHDSVTDRIIKSEPFTTTGTESSECKSPEAKENRIKNIQAHNRCPEKG